MRTTGVIIVVAGLAATATCAEFSTQPFKAATISAVGWPTELHVSDSDTLEIRVRLDDSTDIAGLRVRWEAANPAILSVAALTPPANASREDTLVLQRRAIVRGLRGGIDTVRVTIEGNAFAHQDFSRVIVVSQKWISVSVGDQHTCGVTVDSLAFCWGAGGAGALGNARAVNTLIPAPVVSFGQVKFVAVAASDFGTCGLSSDAVGYCWGSGLKGRLGNNDASENNQYTPGVISGGAAFQSLSGGARVNCGVKPTKEVLCWGDDNFYQLGSVGPPPLDTCSDGVFCMRTPRRVDRPLDQASSVDVGGSHVCAIATGASVGAFCWGYSLNFALGAGATTQSFVPLAVSGGSAFVAISAGGEHTCALTATGAAQCWGLGTQGQLGNGGTSTSMTPVPVSTSTAFQSISAGGNHTCALALNGTAYCWGRAVDGQLGTGSATQVNAPTVVQGGLRFSSVSAGVFHTCGVTVDGSMYCWGSGPGAGSATTLTTPKRMSEP
ncbi:MAG TPA: hypothetical protein VFT29_18540 [Gemmatimonadaceae bacterium]|nr:hypothetical protein [Gemmatimonadaceae bacterium]